MNRDTDSSQVGRITSRDEDHGHDVICEMKKAQYQSHKSTVQNLSTETLVKLLTGEHVKIIFTRFFQVDDNQLLKPKGNLKQIVKLGEAR